MSRRILMTVTITLTVLADLILAVRAAAAQEIDAVEPQAEVTAGEAPPAGEEVLSRGTVGLTFAVPSGGAPTVGASYFLDENRSLRVDVGFAVSSTEAEFMDERSTVTGFSAEVGYRLYQARADRLRPFLQPGVFLSKAAQEGDFGDLVTLALTGALGVEYLFTDRFSLGGATGLSLVAARGFDRISLTTSTSALFASFYW